MSLFRIPLGLLTWVLSLEISQAQLRIGEDTTLIFAAVDDARKILTSRDDFVKRLSPFDRAARLKTDGEVSESHYLRFVGEQVREWSDSEKQLLDSAFQGIRTKVERLALALPKHVYLVRTTGEEEGGAPYTRANAIVIPKSAIAAPVGKLRKLLAHELFHIISRANPKLREELYRLIGFEKCDEVEIPAELKSRKITNPDAPANDHIILLKILGKDVWAVPILFSRAERYDSTRGGEFFSYLQFKFLVVERDATSTDVKPVYDDGKPRLVDLEQVSGFHEQVGRNTAYIIHPEEILADNFALLVLGESEVPTPRVIEGMKQRLKSTKLTGPAAPGSEEAR